MRRIGLRTTRTIVAALICGAATSTFAADDAKVTFDDHVLPILKNSCLNCHNPDKKKGDLDASSFNGLMAGGGSGKVVLPEDADGSLFWKAINHLEDLEDAAEGTEASRRRVGDDQEMD